MIELANISKCFNSGKTNEYLALDNISATINRGEITVLKGPSGSGKTTLLTLIGCMSRPTSGRIRLKGIRPAFLQDAEVEKTLDISSLPERFLTQIRRNSFGFIFQQFNLIKGITVLENIMLPAFPSGEPQPEIRKRALELLERFNIAKLATSKIEFISGGELQRVAIARALINDPEVIIADEPTAHLDSSLSQDFMELIGAFSSKGKTILIASHDPIVFEHRNVDRVIEMRDGRIIPDGF